MYTAQMRGTITMTVTQEARAMQDLHTRFPEVDVESLDDIIEWLFIAFARVGDSYVIDVDTAVANRTDQALSTIGRHATDMMIIIVGEDGRAWRHTASHGTHTCEKGTVAFVPLATAS